MRSYEMRRSPEILEQELPREHPLCGLYLSRREANAPLDPVINMSVRHGVRSALEYQHTGDVERARRLSNPELSPHLAFLDLGGHGYATVRASREAFECEFVYIPRPIERVVDGDNVPVLYRIVHRTPRWKAGEPPRIEQRVLEGQPVLSLSHAEEHTRCDSFRAWR